MYKAFIVSKHNFFHHTYSRFLVDNVIAIRLLTQQATLSENLSDDLKLDCKSLLKAKILSIDFPSFFFFGVITGVYLICLMPQISSKTRFKIENASLSRELHHCRSIVIPPNVQRIFI